MSSIPIGFFIPGSRNAEEGMVRAEGKVGWALSHSKRPMAGFVTSGSFFF